jgi:prefoldin subunit 5
LSKADDEGWQAPARELERAIEALRRRAEELPESERAELQSQIEELEQTCQEYMVTMKQLYAERAELQDAISRLNGGGNGG